MTTTKETYRLTAQIHIPAWLPMEPGCLPLPRQALPQDFSSGSLAVGIAQATPHATVLDVELVLELPFDEEYMQPKWQNPPAICFESTSSEPGLPADRTSLVRFAADTQLAQWVRPLIIRLAHETRAPAFLTAFDYTPYPLLIPTIHVKVKNYEFEIKPTTGKTVGVHPPGRVVTRTQLLDLISRKTHLHDYFGASSDISYYKIDLPATIVWLTTTLEVAAYHYLKAKVVAAIGKKGDKFSPVTYLATSHQTVAGGLSLKHTDVVAFIGCEELWGTRHEIVHNGRCQIRCFDHKQGTASLALVRPLKDQDVHDFRAAVVRAIAWMKSA